jgi:hypothetical protein
MADVVARLLGGDMRQPALPGRGPLVTVLVAATVSFGLLSVSTARLLGDPARGLRLPYLGLLDGVDAWWALGSCAAFSALSAAAGVSGLVLRRRFLGASLALVAQLDAMRDAETGGAGIPMALREAATRTTILALDGQTELVVVLGRAVEQARDRLQAGAGRPSAAARTPRVEQTPAARQRLA